jgi:hypothetical protein
MKFYHRLAHWLVPRESNNQKAKLLHFSGLSLVTLAFVFYQICLTFFPSFGPRVLGYAAQISPEEVISLTNQKRAAVGLLPLTENTTLSQAAQAKGSDMLTKGYWAHVAPDGTTPWQFFQNFGYKYRYAGENLARDFADANSAVEAWMNSSSHRENLLSPQYREIGVAVVEGRLTGVETTLIVQFFGSKSEENPALASEVLAKEPITTASSSAPLNQVRGLISPFGVTQKVALVLVGLLIFILLVDGAVVWSRKITRISGRTLAHLLFLAAIAAAAVVLKVGQIL